MKVIVDVKTRYNFMCITHNEEKLSLAFSKKAKVVTVKGILVSLLLSPLLV